MYISTAYLLALLALVGGATTSLQAGIVSGTVSGLIGGPPEPPGFPAPPTTDKFGFFGPVGANLSGDPVSISYSYDSSLLSGPSSCGTNCTLYGNVMQSQPGNSVSVTINGVTKSYSSPVVQAVVQFQNSYSGYSANWFSEGILTGATSVNLVLFTSNGVAFGQPIQGIVPNQTITFLTGCIQTSIMDSCSGEEDLAFIIGETKLLQITTTSLPSAVSGQSYSATLAASGGVGAYTWEYFYPNSLPVGFVFSPAGVLSSTGSPPAPAGSYSFLAQVDDSAFNVATQEVILVIAPAPTKAPSILNGGIAPAGSGSAVSVIQPGEWVSIYGANLASSTMAWSGDFPKVLVGTSVTINGNAAYLSYVSPTQINLQAPDDTATGPVPVVITTAGGTGTSTVTLAQFGPSFLLLDSEHVAGIILRSNGSGAYGGGAYDIIGPTGNSLGYPTVAAKAGDAIELFGTGFGPTNPAVSAGRAFAGAAPTTNPVNLLINSVSVTPSFAGLSEAGVCQINVIVPAGLGSGDVSLAAMAGGVQTPPNVLISLR
jgi:uncharacterized protein (TIGR03437 family)